MYNSHVPAIRSFCLESPDNTERMLRFVLATIQQGLSTVPQIMEDMDTHGVESRFLFGSKRRGFAYIAEHKEYLHSRVWSLYDPVEAIELFSTIPGIGVVKAGFCAQLLGLPTGCIDSHNLVVHNINPNAVKIPSTLSANRRVQRIHEYVDLTHQLGGAEYLWDSWCDYVAGNRANKQLQSAEQVSALHYEVICL